MGISPVEIDAITGAAPLLRFDDFRDIPLDDRWEAINSELVKREMLAKLPMDIRKIFIDVFLNPDGKDRKLAKLKEFFALPETSVVTSHIINHKPSSHKALEPLYNKRPVRLVDQYFYDCPAGDAIPDRLNVVVANLPYWIRKAGENKDVIKIIVPGSGPAQDIIRILVENPDLQDKVEAYCIDNEPCAIELGEKLAREAGIADKVRYIKGDLMEVDYHDMDLALLVGIICPLPNKVSAMVIGRVASYCRKDGFVVVSAVLQKMLIEDPVTCFVMDFIGWKLHYKREEDMVEVIAKAGLTWRSSFQDPKSKYHRIVIGNTNPY